MNVSGLPDWYVRTDTPLQAQEEYPEAALPSMSYHAHKIWTVNIFVPLLYVIYNLEQPDNPSPVLLKAENNYV